MLIWDPSLAIDVPEIDAQHRAIGEHIRARARRRTTDPGVARDPVPPTRQRGEGGPSPRHRSLMAVLATR
jgi:hypothetical protein